MAVHAPATAFTSPAQTETLIKDLARLHASALLVWPPPGEAAPDLTVAARAAGKAGVPIIELRPEADYRTVSRLVAGKTLAQTSHVLQYGDHVHRALAEVLARGSGIPAMARAITGLSHCPVMVVAASGELLAASGFGSAKKAAEAGRLLTENLASLRGGSWAGTGPFELELVSEQPAREFAADGAERPVRALGAAIVFGGELYGWLLLIEPSGPLDDHDLAHQRVIAEHGATLTGSEMLRLHSIEVAEERARGDFVDCLIHRRFADQYELQARARHHRFDVDRSYAVYVVTAAALTVGRRDPGYMSAMMRIIHAIEPPDERRTLAAPVGTSIVVILRLPKSPAELRDSLREQPAVAQYAHQLHRALRGKTGEDLRITYGQSGHGAQGVAAGYYEAQVAMGLARRTGAAPVCGYGDLRIFAAIKDVAASDEGRAFARETLGALRRVRSQTGDLEQIVLAYIKASGNLNAAARSLNLHRNTMLYKLERASRALRMDIRLADTQFMVWLAHHIDILASVTGTMSDELAPPGDDHP
ncbi:PucR family transcriptional regulator [Sinosporangium siamense]|uniref:PucR family transcriptional regulator n=1 Tax=Sinosporangium siamense TaxID=1367973 RepID=A0A919RFA2_9ACTN|nr:helix-turn-helix domain-containing protein [Sinosporangium siamense]GII92322.1 PucR family transcriptional regulator [Sinosporangium siamense]